MAGDNVAINAGLALIKLIQQILELIMKVMDHKAGKLENENKNLKAQLKEKDDKIKAGEGDIDKLKQERDDIKKRLDDNEKKLSNINKARENVNAMINEPGNASIVSAINSVGQGRNTLTNSEVLQLVNILQDRAAAGLGKEARDSIRGDIEAAVRRTMPVNVPDNVHQALSQIDSNYPYNAATINQYINVNIDSPNVDKSVLQGVKDIQQAFQDGRAVLRNNAPVQTDAQQMTYGKNLGSSMGTMTFGGKAAAGTQQKSVAAHDEAK